MNAKTNALDVARQATMRAADDLRAAGIALRVASATGDAMRIEKATATRDDARTAYDASVVAYAAAKKAARMVAP